jgi:hypothetical protein
MKIYGILKHFVLIFVFAPSARICNPCLHWSLNGPNGLCTTTASEGGSTLHRYYRIYYRCCITEASTQLLSHNQNRQFQNALKLSLNDLAVKHKKLHKTSTQTSSAKQGKQHFYIGNVKTLFSVATQSKTAKSKSSGNFKSNGEIHSNEQIRHASYYNLGYYSELVRILHVLM